jgi:hypothetical protein
MKLMNVGINVSILTTNQYGIQNCNYESSIESPSSEPWVTSSPVLVLLFSTFSTHYYYQII